MGSWGVKARESDTGLDYFAIIEKQCLQKVDYAHFDISVSVTLLKSHILNGILRENKGSPKEMMDEYIEADFPYRYAHAVLMIAECLTEYFINGVFVAELYEAGRDEPSTREITQFVYTTDDLKSLLSELEVILTPEHDLYETWEESDHFHEWQAHVMALRECIKNRISSENP